MWAIALWFGTLMHKVNGAEYFRAIFHPNKITDWICLAIASSFTICYTSTCLVVVISYLVRRQKLPEFQYICKVPQGSLTNISVTQSQLNIPPQRDGQVQDELKDAEDTQTDRIRDGKTPDALSHYNNQDADRDFNTTLSPEDQIAEDSQENTIEDICTANDFEITYKIISQESSRSPSVAST